MSRNRPLIASLILVIVVTAALTAWLLFAPSSTAFSAQGITANISRTRLPLAGSCFDLTWDASEGAALDGSPIDAAGAESLCTWHDHIYTLSDGAAGVSIPVSIVTLSPIFWLIAMTPLFCLTALLLLIFAPHPVAHSPLGEGVSGIGAQFISSTHSSFLSPPLVKERGLGGEILLILVAFAALVIALWIPFGLGGNATVDNWEYRGWFESGTFPWFHAPVSPHRPFTYVTDGLNYLLTPDSFAGLNLLLIGFITAKGVLLYTLLRRLLPDQRMLALATALVFVLHPIDSFYMGGISTQPAIIFLLIAAHLLLSYWRRPSVITFGAAQVFALLSLSIYEVPIPLLLALPLLLLLDTPKLSRRWLGVTALWAILPLVWGIYFAVWYVTSPSSYFAWAGEVATGGISKLRALIEVYNASLIARFIDAARSFVGALRGLSSRLIFAAGGAVVALLLGWWLLRSESRLSIRRAAVLIAAGLTIIFLGVVVYIPSNLFQTYAFLLTHPYFAANLGAALVIGTVITLLPRRFLQIGALALIVAVLMPYLIAQHRTAQNNAGDTARSLYPIVRLLPEIEPDTDILILDEGRRLTANLYEYVVDSALRVIYDTGDVRGRHCAILVAEGAPLPDNPTIASCRFTPSGVEVNGYDEFRDVPAYSFYRGERDLLPYEHLVIVQVTDTGIGVLPTLSSEWGIATDAYQPLERVHFDAPPPPRLATMFEVCNCLSE